VELSVTRNIVPHLIMLLCYPVQEPWGPPLESHVLWVACLLLSYTCPVNLTHAIIIVIIINILCRLNIINIIWVGGDLTVN